MSEQKIIGYHEGDGFIYRLSAASKLLFFILVSIAAMVSYDTRLLLGIALLSLSLFRLSGIRLREVSVVLIATLVFATLNAVMVYFFSPEYGVELYQSRQVLWQGVGHYTLTSQELFYLVNLLVKYICTIPLAIVFLMTTHPSQFASSLNQIGVPYKVAYAVSLTMRYIPDLQEEFQTIRLSQQARGLELSQKGKLSQRIKGNLALVIPLIFSSLERIDTVSTAMALRRFGKHQKRTWYTYRSLKVGDWVTIAVAILFVGLAVGCFYMNGSRFYNPWQ